MLKYQVRTLGRGEKRRQSAIPIKDLFKAIELEQKNQNDPSLQEQQSSPTGSSSSSSGNESCESPVNGRKKFSVEESTTDSYHLGNLSPWQQRFDKHHLHGSNVPQPGRHLRARGRSTSVSSLSSTSTSSDSAPIEWGQIRVYTSVIRPDTTYFTLFVNTATTTEELIQMAVLRLRMRYKDPQLFYLTMELDTKLEANEVRNALVLAPGSKPLELQACHPKEKSKFVLMAQETCSVKIYVDFSISQTSNYKSALVTQRMSCKDVIIWMLQQHKLSACNPDDFVLVVIDDMSERILYPTESLFEVCQQIDINCQQIYIKPLSHVLANIRTMDAKTYAQLANKFRQFVL